MCEPYALGYPNTLVFALRSQSGQNLHLGFSVVFLGFLALLGFWCYQGSLKVISYDYFS
jgi:hypothetical protein